MLAGSLAFYILCSWKSIFFILFTTIVIYLLSLKINSNRQKEKAYLSENTELTIDEKKAFKNKNKKIRKSLLVIGIVLIVGVLAMMKYFNFMLDNLNGIIKLFNTNASMLHHVNWLLPLGISFYTFQAIGYIADVYWGKYEPEKNFFKFLLFMSFFPKIMQGPIIRYNEIKDSLFEGHDFNYDSFVDGLKRMLWGYFKKMVIADCFVVFVKAAFADPLALSGLETISCIVLYFIYDYCDFSGYMDIACGTGILFGVKLPENFNHPYFAMGIDEYWRRWHMTLGAWFKDYIFYPLSVSKWSLKLGKWSKKIFKKHANKIPAIIGLIIVWFLTGLWHGASWNYILWGLYFGIIIIISIIIEPLLKWFYEKTKINPNSIGIKIFKHVRTLIFLAIGKVLFETNSLQATFTFLGRIFVADNYFNLNFLREQPGAPSIVVASICSLLVLVVDLIQELKPETTFIDKTKKLPVLVQWLLLILLIVCIVWFGYYGSGLPKFNFGYMEF